VTIHHLIDMGFAISQGGWRRSSINCTIKIVRRSGGGSVSGSELYHGLDNFVLPSCGPISPGNNIISCAVSPIKTTTRNAVKEFDKNREDRY
jgi:hypothetical protein